MELSSVLQPPQRMDAQALANGVQRGEMRAIARLMTLVENEEAAAIDVVNHLNVTSQGSICIGITGYPGVGKSSLVAQLVSVYRKIGKRVGVIAVDPTSPTTGGAFLGDRIRMLDHAGDPGVFIRSLATRGHRGGLAKSTAKVVTVLKAAGYDVILIETVGVGQEDTAIVEVADVVVAVVTPGLGDEVQAMKAGLFELAHIIVVNKGDHEGADQAVQDLTEWVPQVLRTNALSGGGIPELIEAISEHSERQCKMQN